MPLYAILLHHAFITALAALTPITASLLAAGLLTSFVQAAFQIEDATFSLLPKTLLMVLIALFGGFGALALLSHYATDCISHAPALARRAWW